MDRELLAGLSCQAAYTSRNRTTAKGTDDDCPFVIVLKFKDCVIEQVQATEKPYNSFPDFILKGLD